MSEKISKQQLDKIIDQVREETKKDFSDRIQKVIGEQRDISIDEFTKEIIPKLLSATFVTAGFHAEYIIHDVLSELDLLEK